MTVVILGCGYTGGRVAQRMLTRGATVIATSRSLDRIRSVGAVQAIELDVERLFSLDFVPAGSLVLHSIPPLPEDDPFAIANALGDRPRRVVYLSTTGVYGAQAVVDEATLPQPRHERDHQRLRAEQAVTRGPWSSMILRPAAIYGPGRGVHASMQAGRFRLLEGGHNYVSRIHVDDLAAHAEAALLSDETGAWPVADEEPCTSAEIATFCASLLGVPLPGSDSADSAHHTRRADRRVDGSAIRWKLGIALRYPSYRQGIPASLAEGE